MKNFILRMIAMILLFIGGFNIKPHIWIAVLLIVVGSAVAIIAIKNEDRRRGLF